MALMAGSWYPDDPSELRNMIEEFLQHSQCDYQGAKPHAMLAPHAGYIYSGQVAACGYKALRDARYDTIVVIAPSHRETFPGVSLFDGEAYNTPLGRLPVGRELLRAIAAHGDGVKLRLSQKGHRDEHSLELQLPFLQVVQDDFQLVPIVMGDQNYTTAERLAEVLFTECSTRQCLVVASTDLSHFHSQQTAERLDGRFIELFTANQPQQLAEELLKGSVEACGGGPVLTAMLYNELCGGSSCTAITYNTSMRMTHDADNVVGYFAGVMA